MRGFSVRALGKTCNGASILILSIECRIKAWPCDVDGTAMFVVETHGCDKGLVTVGVPTVVAHVVLGVVRVAALAPMTEMCFAA